MKYGRISTGKKDRNSPSRMAFAPTCCAMSAVAVSGAMICGFNLLIQYFGHFLSERG